MRGISNKRGYEQMRGSKDVAMTVRSVLDSRPDPEAKKLWTSSSNPVHWSAHFKRVKLGFTKKGVWNRVNPALRGADPAVIFENTFDEEAIDVDQEVIDELVRQQDLADSAFQDRVVLVNATFVGNGAAVVRDRTEAHYLAEADQKKALLAIEQSESRIRKDFKMEKRARDAKEEDFDKDSQKVLQCFSELFDSGILIHHTDELAECKFRSVMIQLIAANSGVSVGSTHLGVLNKIIIGLKFDGSMPMTDNLLALETLFDQANELQDGNVSDGSKLVHLMSFVENGSAHVELKNLVKNLPDYNRALTYKELRTELLTKFNSLVSKGKIKTSIGIEIANVATASSSSSQVVKTKCAGCFNVHGGPCKLINVICNNCGKKGHLANKCPNEKAESTGKTLGNRAKNQLRKLAAKK